MLTPDDLSSMRNELNRALPDTADIQRLTLTTDSAGGYTESWSSVASGVACRIAPSGNAPFERIIADRLASASTWTITLPALTDIRPDDRIVSGGLVYQVVGVAGRSYEISRRVVCTRVV